MGFADRHYERVDDDGNPPRQHFRMQGMSPTIWLIVIHVIFFILCVFDSPTIRAGPGSYFLFFKPYVLEQHQYWRLFTYFIVENQPLNLLLSMFTLYFVGRLLEMVWGWRKLYLCYVLFAFAGGIAATLFVFIFNPVPNNTLLYGASAPVMGLIVATTFRFDNLQGTLPFSNAPFSLKTFLWFLIAFMVITTLVGLNTYVALAASAGGGLAGYLWVTFVKEKSQVPSGKQGWFARFLTRRRQKKREQEAKDLAALEVEVDRILDKVRQHGLHSLTEPEKRSLKRATELQNKKPTRL